MLGSLSEKLQSILSKIKNKGLLTEKDIQQSLREVKIALLEADVHYKVVKDFIQRLGEYANQEEISKALTPGQQMVKITHKVLTEILGTAQSEISMNQDSQTVILLVGLQGSGKTTSAVKLALKIKNKGHQPLLIAADKVRPAAAEQLKILGDKAGIQVFLSDKNENTLKTIHSAFLFAKNTHHDVIIIDTAGRLHIDTDLIQEIKDIKSSIHVDETLLVIDSLIGQDGLRVADTFNQEIGIDGYILTKLDGDSRGGIALSIKNITNLPIKYVGIGEKIGDLEPFHPDRMASRILGMGDTLTLIEKIEESYDKNEIKNLGKKEYRDQFSLNDFYEQLKKIKNMGSLEKIMSLIPTQNIGLPKGFEQKIGTGDTELKRIEAIICSMTNQEKINPDIINGSRRRRIAKGSGTNVSDVNRLINQFYKMKKILKLGTSKRSLFSLMR